MVSSFHVPPSTSNCRKVRHTAWLQGGWSEIHQSAQVTFQDTALPLARCLFPTSLTALHSMPKVPLVFLNHASRIILRSDVFPPSVHPLFTMLFLTQYHFRMGHKHKGHSNPNKKKPVSVGYQKKRYQLVICPTCHAPASVSGFVVR